MYKFVYGFLLVIVLGSSGCSEWLDVQPKTSVPEEDLFADEFGFQDALTGFYLKMGESSLYGRELTYKYMEMLAGRNEYAPHITNSTSNYNYDGTYKKIQNTYNTMLSAIESKVNNYNEAENIKNSAYNAWIASGGNASSDEYVAYKTAEENLKNKQREIEEAKQL